MKPGDTVMKTTGEYSPSQCIIVGIHDHKSRPTAEVNIPDIGLYMTYLDYLEPLCDYDNFEVDE